MFYERNIARENIYIAFNTVCCAVSRVTSLPSLSSSSVHECWIAVARVIVFVYGPVCFYVHSCHIKALVLG